jgi:hypothetical protein
VGDRQVEGGDVGGLVGAAGGVGAVAVVVGDGEGGHPQLVDQGRAAVVGEGAQVLLVEPGPVVGPGHVVVHHECLAHPEISRGPWPTDDAGNVLPYRR